MFHLWQNTNNLPQTNRPETNLYAVALPSVANTFAVPGDRNDAPLGGIRPQGQYPASPLSASECAKAKHGFGLSEIAVNELTGTIASHTHGADASNLMLQSVRVMETAFAGRAGSVAQRNNSLVSLQSTDGNPPTQAAMSASAKRSAYFITVYNG